MQNIAKLDKIGICNFKVVDIVDLDNLAERGIVEISKTKEMNRVELASGERIHSLMIKDDALFIYLRYVIDINDVTRSTLELTTDYNASHNLAGFTMEEYKLKLIRVQEHLEQEYGIIVDFTFAKFNYLEIQKTIELDYEFESYQRAIAMIMLSLPQKLHLKNNAIWQKYVNTSNGNIKLQNKTFVRSSGKRGFDVVVYDKSEDLRERCNIFVPDNRHYLRLELKLKSEKLIYSRLGTSSLWFLSDDIINSFYNNFVKECICESFESGVNKRIRALKRMYKDYESGTPAEVARKMLTKLSMMELADSETPLLFDMHEMNLVIDSVHKGKDTKYRMHRKRLRDAFKYEARNSFSIYAQESKARFDEIISKVLTVV